MIAFLNLARINAQYRASIDKAIQGVLDSGWYIKGNAVKEFEAAFSNYIGTNYSVGTGNGLDALKLILRAYRQTGKLNPGDEVIVPANTFIATILAVAQEGLKPVFADPDPNTFNLSAESIEKAYTSKTKAVVLVHLYGQICWSPEIEKFAQDHELLIIEDAAQAAGAKYEDKMAGNLGHAAAFSFYPGKNLGALGDGGCVTSNDEELIRVVRSLGNYGSEVKYKHDFDGYNSRLDELQAAILVAKLGDLDGQNEKRSAIANRYLAEIKNHRIILPKWDYSQKHCWHLFVIRSQERSKLMEYLESNGVAALIHYPISAHQQTPFNNGESFPISEQLQDEILSIPMDPTMTNEEVQRVIDIVNQFQS